jgi:sugar phosphate isomerase/epimerase
MGRYSLGTTYHPFGQENPATWSKLARDLGFDHVDVPVGVDAADLALPVGIAISSSGPVPGRAMAAAYYPGEGQWEACAAAFRDAPECLMEPITTRIVNSLATIRAMKADVPGLGFVIDTGHVANWGEDPLELLDYADHVQLRQGAPGQPQLHVDDPVGVVDFAAVLGKLDRIGYKGLLTVEYFDLPDLGYPLEDPLAFTVDLARHVRGLMG